MSLSCLPPFRRRTHVLALPFAVAVALGCAATAAAIAQPVDGPEPASKPDAAPAGSGDADLAALPKVSVKAKAGREGTTEGRRSYTTESMSTATRLNLSPRETPQSVSVVGRQQMDDQNIQSVEELTNVVTGLTLNKGATERASFYSRGFQINSFTQDGLPMSNSADTLGFSTLAIYDRVEILRGAGGLAVGAGNPGGVLNFVRKRPTADTRVAVTGSAGRYSNYRGEVDVSGALNEAKTVRGRAVVAARDSDTFISNYRQQRALAYGTVDVDLSRNTVLSVGFHHNKEENPGSTWYGLPTAADGSFLPLPRSASNAPDWTYWNKSNTRVFADLEHQFDGGWKVRVAAQALKDKLDSTVTGFERVTGRPVETFAVTPANIFVYDRDQRTVDANVSGPVELFGRRHDLVFGVTHRTLDQDDVGFRDLPYRHEFTVDHWDVGAAPRPNITERYYGQATRTDTTGIYSTGRFKLSDPLALIAGLRADWYTYRAVNTQTGAVTADYNVSREITPYLGAVYDLDDTYSVYGSWTRIFNPQSARDVSGNLLDPVTGTNLEAGVKAAYFGGGLNVTAAVFRVIQENLAVTLPPASCPVVGVACSEAAGEVRSQGIELEASGELSRGWQVAGGVTVNSAEYTKSQSATNPAGTRFAAERPTRLLRLSTNYRLPGALSAWRVGGAVRAQNEIFRTVNAIRQGGYTIVDLMAGWEVNRQLDLRFNVTNLFDKTYYQAISAPSSGNAFGEPLNFSVTAKYTF